MIVQELGWDDDVDEELRADIMDLIDADLIEDAVEADMRENGATVRGTDRVGADVLARLG